MCLGGPHSDEHLLGSRSLQPPELCCALCDMWSPPQSGFHGPFSTRARGPPGLYCAPCSTRSPPWSRSCRPSPPGPAALLGCAVCRVVRGPLHRAGPTDLCRGPRPPELGSTFLGPRCPAGSLPSAPGPAPSEAARLGAPSVPGQGEAVLLPTWEQEGRMRSPALPSAYLQNQAPHSGAVSSHGGLQNQAPHSGAVSSHRGPGGRSHSSPSATPGSARPLSQGPWQEHCSQGQTHASR